MRLTSRTGLGAILALATAAASAAAAAPPPAWVVNPAASHLTFTAQMNGDAIHGAFRRWTAHIVFDPANLAASQVTATIDTASAATGDETRDEALPTGDWFAAKIYPQATFTSHAFKAAGPGRYLAIGDLRIRNVTRPVTIPFTLTITGDVAHMTGALPIDRTAFGVGQGQFKGTDAVAAGVQVQLDITARRAKA
jgi:polyisoprenoid-binding protein YceI